MLGVMRWTLVALGDIKQPMSSPARPAQACRKLSKVQLAQNACVKADIKYTDTVYCLARLEPGRCAAQSMLVVDLACAPQTGMVNPLLVQLPEMSSTSSTSSLRTALPTASTVPKAIVVFVPLMALKDDAAQHMKSGMTTSCRTDGVCTSAATLYVISWHAAQPDLQAAFYLNLPFLPGRSIGDWAVPVWHIPFQSEPSPAPCEFHFRHKHFGMSSASLKSP